MFKRCFYFWWIWLADRYFGWIFSGIWNLWDLVDFRWFVSVFINASNCMIGLIFVGFAKIHGYFCVSDGCC